MEDASSDKIRIICVDKGRELASMVQDIFDIDQITLAFQRTLDEVVDRFEREVFDLMLFSSSVTQGQQSNAIEILELISAKCPRTQILFFMDPNQLKLANKALRAGAFHYSSLPVTREELKLLIETAMEIKPQLGPNMLLCTDDEKNTFEKMIGRSQAVQQVYRQIRQAAATDIPVLLIGETGTGKELAAQAIHELSPRGQAPCIPVHIGSLPPDLVASELFGHERGAFTNATHLRKGAFETADGGSVFLDEIATIDPKMQISLLRLLETSEFCRIGSLDNISVDVRIIAATNADLTDEIQKGNFREDLYYRLDVLRIEMPPLRERHGDISLLADYFIKTSADDFKKNVLGVSSDFIGCLEAYPWPGNIRELKNVIQRTVISSTGEILKSSDLPDRIQQYEEEDAAVTIRVGQTLADVEKELIARTLKYNRNNRTKTSKMLEISRRSLYNKIQQYGL